MVTFKVSLVCVFVLLVVHDACAWDTIRLSQINRLTLNKGALTLGKLQIIFSFLGKLIDFFQHLS